MAVEHGRLKAVHAGRTTRSLEGPTDATRFDRPLWCGGSYARALGARRGSFKGRFRELPPVVGTLTAAALIERNSGPFWGLPAYGLAAFTAFERVEEGHQYPSDVLAGAAIGVLSAGLFDSLHWGKGGQGGIARPSMKLSLNMDGLRRGELSRIFGS